VLRDVFEGAAAHDASRTSWKTAAPAGLRELGGGAELALLDPRAARHDRADLRVEPKPIG